MQPLLEELIAFSGLGPGLVVVKGFGGILIGEGELHGVPLAGDQESCGEEKIEGDEPSLMIYGLGVHHGAVHGPDGTWYKEGVDGEHAKHVDMGYKLPSGTLANLYAVNLPFAWYLSAPGRLRQGRSR